MADKAITDLNVIPGSIDDSNTWFAVAQSGAAYKVSGHDFVLAMSSIWEAHGGIRSIVYADPVPPSLTGTLTITLADNTSVSYDVENGRGIASIAKTGTVDLVDTYTITYNDGTTSTFSVTNGEKGDTGDAWYVWIRYAGSRPTQDSDIGTTPDNWMGIYSGTSSTAPVHYTDYDWFQIKGEKGDTGEASVLVSNDVQYQQSDNGSVVPSGSWSSSIPAPVAGKYLWTRTVLTFNNGSPVTSYSVSRYGIDGTGSVSTVNSVSPDGNGNVVVTASDIGTSDSTSVQSDLTSLKNTLNQLESGIAIIIDGNKATVTVSKGQYVLVKNSTITGITDGLYIYNSSTPKTAGNTFVSSELNDAPTGGLNSLNDKISAFKPELISTFNLTTDGTDHAFSLISGKVFSDYDLIIIEGFTTNYIRYSGIYSTLSSCKDYMILGNYAGTLNYLAVKFSSMMAVSNLSSAPISVSVYGIKLH